jgi:uncharacterized protein (DUF849 family)
MESPSIPQAMRRIVRRIRTFKKETSMKITTASTLGEVMGNPKSAAVFDKYSPGASTNPMTKLGYKYTLEKLSTIKQAKFTPEKFQALMAEFEALGDV